MTKKNAQKKNAAFAKLFVFVPEKNDNAIVLRRGPAKAVGMFNWNIRTDKIDEFQWLKGRIYEYFSDVSPDGKYFLYSANKKGLGYTAVSFAPWLKAISFWNNVGGYGGGIFTGNNQYLLFDGSENYNKFRCQELTHGTEGWHLLKHGVYPGRLEKTGWNLINTQDTELLFRKNLKNNMILEKIWKKNIGMKTHGKGAFFEYHRVVINSEVSEYQEWEWCEWVKNHLVWAENGCLFRASLSVDDHICEPQIIHDFNQYEFVEKQATY